MKTCLNSEHNAFKKYARQEVLDHHEKANANQFYQFTHGGATLINKNKHQAFGMHFADTQFRHNNSIAL